MDELGTRLRDARVARGLSLDDVANATKIPKSSLASLESERFELLPAPVFVRGFIRSFARAVGCDPNPLVRSYEARVAAPPAPSPSPMNGRRESAIEKRLDTNRKLVPLQPVSERREGGFRNGFALIAIAAVGLLFAAWLLVGQKKPATDASARLPTAPVMHERINGVPAIDAPVPGDGLRAPDARVR